MMKTVAVAATLAFGLALCVPAQADVLLIQQVNKEHQLNLPARGMTMAQVRKRYGAPVSELPTRGGGAPLQPPINRWQYPDYTVYFERNRVIHAVVNPPASDGGS